MRRPVHTHSAEARRARQSSGSSAIFLHRLGGLFLLGLRLRLVLLGVALRRLLLFGLFLGRSAAGLGESGRWDEEPSAGEQHGGDEGAAQHGWEPHVRGNHFPR